MANIHMTIGKKLFVTVASLIFVVLISQGAISNQIISTQLEKDVNANMEQDGQTLVEMLQRMLAQAEADMDILRAHESFKNYLTLKAFEDEDGMVDEESRLEAFLSHAAKANPKYKKIQFTAGDQPVLQLTDGVRTEKTSRYDTTKAKTKTARSGGSSNVAHFVDHNNGEFALLSVGAIQLSGKNEGWLWLYQPIRREIDKTLVEFANKGFAAVISGDKDRLIAHTKAHNASLAKELSRGQIDGWLSVHTKLPELGWTVTLGIEKSKAFFMVRKLTIIGMVVLVTALLLSVAVLGLLVSRLITRPLGGEPAEMANLSRLIADGDLTVEFDDAGKKHGVYTAMKEMVEGLKNTVHRVYDNIEHVSNATKQIASSSETMLQRTEEHAAALEETAASMEELTTTVRKNAENATTANQLAASAQEQAARGGQVVAGAISSMSEISQASQKMADIIDVIEGIAFQTNLLALNAAVESARAGEEGRGFAVVATEVRNLAQRSSDAAKEIKELITNSVNKVDEGNQLVNDSGTALNEIMSAIKKVSDIVADITAASREQSNSIDHVTTAIMQMDEMTQNNVTMVEETTSAITLLDEQAQDLQTLMSFFKIKSVAKSLASSEVANSDTHPDPELKPGSRSLSIVSIHGNR